MNQSLTSSILLVLITSIWMHGCTGISTNHLLKQGLHHYSQQDYEQAQTSFNRVLVNQPDHCVARLCLGWISYYSKDYPVARQEFERVLSSSGASDPDKTDAWHGLARCAYQTGQYISAANNAKKSLELTSQQMELWLLLGWSELYCSEIAKAEDAYKKAIILETDNWEAWLGIGWVRFYQNDFSGAIAAVDRARHWDVEVSAVNKLVEACHAVIE
ncbi:tetratricopeptide repeat protein [bacterium]|nr:tetratricopeptide repeat protein [bacterium]